MERYPSCLKYLVLVLALLHSLTGGHLVCYAYSHLSQLNQHEHRCHSPHCQSPGSLKSCCQDVPYDCQHICDGQLATRTLRGTDEAATLVPIPSSDCVSFVSAFYPSVLSDDRDAIAGLYPALPLRLHLFYKVLLI